MHRRTGVGGPSGASDRVRSSLPFQTLGVSGRTSLVVNRGPFRLSLNLPYSTSSDGRWDDGKRPELVSLHREPHTPPHCSVGVGLTCTTVQGKVRITSDWVVKDTYPATRGEVVEQGFWDKNYYSSSGSISCGTRTLKEYALTHRRPLTPNVTRRPSETPKGPHAHDGEGKWRLKEERVENRFDDFSFLGLLDVLRLFE